MGTVGSEAWGTYWKRLAAMDVMVVECQEAAVEVGKKIAEARRGVVRGGERGGYVIFGGAWRVIRG